MSEAITSAAAFFRAANGKRVKKTVSGAPTLFEWEARRRAVVEAIKADGGTNIETDGNGFLFVDRYGWKNFRLGPAPELCESFGIFRVKSKEYGFTPDGGQEGYGDKANSTVEAGALVKDYGGGRVIRYSIEAAQ